MTKREEAEAQQEREEDKAREMVNCGGDHLSELVFDAIDNGSDVDRGILYLEFQLCMHRNKNPQSFGECLIAIINKHVKERSEDYARLDVEGE